VESTPGKGTEFVVALPAVRPAAMEPVLAGGGFTGPRAPGR
jgi:hypothetical protein